MFQNGLFRLAAVFVFCLAAFLASVRGAYSQGQTGVPPFSTVAGGPDAINLADLSIHYLIPVYGRSGRGLPFSFTTSYDNVVWTDSGLGSNLLPEWSPYFGGGSTPIGGVLYTQKTLICEDSHFNQYQYQQYKVTGFQDFQGTSTAFFNTVNTAPSNVGGNCASAHNGFASEVDILTGIRLDFTAPNSANGFVLTAIATLRDGSVINPPVVTCGPSSCGASGGPFTWTDSNGNRITYNWNSNTRTLSNVVDTLGTTVLTYSGAYPNPTNFTYTTPSGASASVTRSFKSYTVQTAFG